MGIGDHVYQVPTVAAAAADIESGGSVSGFLEGVVVWGGWGLEIGWGGNWDTLTLGKVSKILWGFLLPVRECLVFPNPLIPIPQHKVKLAH